MTVALPTAKNRVSVIRGDSLQVLRDLPSHTFDAVITDPPYSSGGRTFAERCAPVATKYVQSGSRRFAAASFDGDNRDQRSWAYWCHLWLSESLRVTKPGGYLLAFIDWRQLPTMTDVVQAAGWLWRGIVPWDKGAASRAPAPRFFRHQCEYIVWATRGAFPQGADWPPSGQGCYPGLYSHPVKQADKHHITGKPTPLMRDLMRCVPPGGLILDPFAGSGTTGKAADLEGRRCVLIEQEAGYCDVIHGRLAEADGGG